MQYLKFSQIAVFFVFIALMFFSVEARAQKVLKDYKVPMPEITITSYEEYEAVSTVHEETPLNDKTLAYSVRVPSGWKELDRGLSNFSVSSKVFGEIARFYGPPRLMGQRSRFTVQVIGLDYQLTAEQWLLQYLLTNGYSIQGFKTIGDERAEALFVLVKDGISYIIRAMAQINGKRVIMAQYFLPINNWDEGKSNQSHVVSSFTLLNKEKKLVEEMKVFRFLDVAEIKYPVSWELRSPPLRSIDRMGAQILNVASKVSGRDKIKYLNGKVDIKLVSVFAADALEEEIKVYKTELEKDGLLIRESLGTEKGFEFNDMFDLSKLEIFDAVDSEEETLDYELWLSRFSAGDYYYFVSLLTPSREDDFFVWSRNTQAYKLILEHIEPLEESLIER